MHACGFVQTGLALTSGLYHSTRGQAPELDFTGATLAGLAVDGGLYVPKHWPHFSETEIAGWRDLSYAAVAEQVLGALCAESIPAQRLQACIAKGLQYFTDPAITPLRQLDERTWILELFHGPTLAFKDVALQFLGQVFDLILGQQDRRATILGATSGDTGSAAIAGCAHADNVDIFILFPKNGPSEIQRRQMTTVAAQHVHAVAIDGSFDDCQMIVKDLFADAAVRQQLGLTAVNSINWARIAAQIVYYFAAALKLGAPAVAPSFVVPTGNFGNIFAGFAALKMGLPIARLAAATNSNNAVHRFMTEGVIMPRAPSPTLSPSMDIQVPSNLERLLFTLTGDDPAAVRAIMSARDLRVTPKGLGMARQYFTSASIDDDTTLQTIRNLADKTGIVLDPHSAVGVAAASVLRRELPDPVVCLGCAHPAKFPETVAHALGHEPTLPPALMALYDLPERQLTLPANRDAVLQMMLAARSR
jgi:threonine synthase